MPYRRSLNIYQLDTTLYIISNTTTKDYYRNYERPPEKIDIDANLEDIGKIVLKALRRCRLGVDEPAQKADLQVKALGIPGIRSWSEINRKGIYCSVIERETEPYHILINVCVKKRGGIGFTGEEYVVDPANTKEIGEKVKLALMRYQPYRSKITDKLT